MKKNMKNFILVLGMVMLLGTAIVSAESMPSTNDDNRDKSWAHYNVINTAPGEATIEFVSTRGFASCFEYRTDGDTSQIIGSNGGVNYNPAITDGLYPFVCIGDETREITVSANSYIEIRTVFGAEGDERFDWTVVDVPSADDVPEFGALAAIGIVALAGLFIYKRRN